MIVTKKELADPHASHFVQIKPGGQCFKCPMPITVPYVIWQGQTFDGTQIALHPHCAQELGANLVTDGAIAAGEDIASA